jgi:general secretion pathway protein J
MRSHRSSNDLERPDSTAGFSLIELLVALALVTLIATYLFGGFTLGRRAWESAHKVEEVASVSAVQDFLRQALLQTYPAPVIKPDNAREVWFEGGEHELHFVAIVQGRTTRGGLFQFDIGLARDAAGAGETPSLRVRQTMYQGPLARDAEALPGYERLLLAKVGQLTFRYFGRQNEREAPVWMPRWTRRDALPDLVGMQLTFPDRDLRLWPELIVELQLRDK